MIPEQLVTFLSSSTASITVPKVLSSTLPISFLPTLLLFLVYQPNGNHDMVPWIWENKHQANKQNQDIEPERYF